MTKINKVLNKLRREAETKYRPSKNDLPSLRHEKEILRMERLAVLDEVEREIEKVERKV